MPNLIIQSLVINFHIESSKQRDKVKLFILTQVSTGVKN